MSEASANIEGSIVENLVAILTDMMEDWDVDLEGGIGRETQLIKDLSFESIDIVELVVSVEERFGKRGLPFEKILMEDGRYVDDLSVGEVADFIGENL